MSTHKVDPAQLQIARTERNQLRTESVLPALEHIREAARLLTHGKTIVREANKTLGGHALSSITATRHEIGIVSVFGALLKMILNPGEFERVERTLQNVAAEPEGVGVVPCREHASNRGA